MGKKRVIFAFSLCMIFVAPKLFATDTSTKQPQLEQEETESSSVAKHAQISEGQPARDMILAAVGLVAFAGLMAFLLRRPKDLDKYDKLYASLLEEKEERENMQKAT